MFKPLNKINHLIPLLEKDIFIEICLGKGANIFHYSVVNHDCAVNLVGVRETKIFLDLYGKIVGILNRIEIYFKNFE